MQSRPLALLLSLVLVMAAGCGPAAGPSRPAGDAAADEATIRAATAHWIDAFNAGDADAIAAMYTDDAVLMPSDSASLKGKAAIREYLVKAIAATKAAGLTDKDGPGDVGISGDLAWHAGWGTAVDAKGNTVGSEKYIEVWQRSGGQWLMVRDIWNEDPAPAPTK